jgi:hypothetical protein
MLPGRPPHVRKWKQPPQSPVQGEAATTEGYDMNTSEVLNKAADLIQERGWITGGDGWADEDSQAPGLCLEGAIMAAAGLRFIGEVPQCPAYRAVADYLGDEVCTLRVPACNYVSPTRLYIWNDESGRTASEVIEVLRAAAVIEAARETESASVSA